MTIKTRIAKLEKTIKPPQATWKDFVSGAWQLPADKWTKFLEVNEAENRSLVKP